MTSFEEFYSKYPNLVFIKSKIPVTDSSEATDENFIKEEDTPPMEKGFSVVLPLYVNEYPKVFAMATAMEAGLYAIDVCEKTGVEISRASILYVLHKLEENLIVEEK